MNIKEIINETSDLIEIACIDKTHARKVLQVLEDNFPQLKWANGDKPTEHVYAYLHINEKRIITGWYSSLPDINGELIKHKIAGEQLIDELCGCVISVDKNNLLEFLGG